MAFTLNVPGETDLPEVWTDPLDVVIDALVAHSSAATLSEHLPDIALWASGGDIR